MFIFYSEIILFAIDNCVFRQQNPSFYFLLAGSFYTHRITMANPIFKYHRTTHCAGIFSLLIHFPVRFFAPVNCLRLGLLFDGCTRHQYINNVRCCGTQSKERSIFLTLCCPLCRLLVYVFFLAVFREISMRQQHR